MVKSPSSDLPSDKRSDDEDEIEGEKVQLSFFVCVFTCVCVGSSKVNICNFQFESLTCSNNQDLAPVKPLSRRGRADRVILKEEEDEEEDEDEENYDEECEQEEFSSSGEREAKEREIKKEGKKEKREESFEIKETKDVKEKKETKPLDAVHKQEESTEKVITNIYSFVIHQLYPGN